MSNGMATGQSGDLGGSRRNRMKSSIVQLAEAPMRFWVINLRAEIGDSHRYRRKPVEIAGLKSVAVPDLEWKYDRVNNPRMDE